ncbi:chromosome replication/partitioning protein (plasmid) [Borreliella valaisiana]|uniref:chromosome replication/partitioning protein n=1 Tax=Borreliella valaisiana TaxID=62088 RepID=UPI002738053C|nr:chromosome replication/partitioning protein [Borreliella valaisiana]WLN25844.1 chromosome replication/partitioning protein [Borreliella valaisiana]
MAKTKKIIINNRIIGSNTSINTEELNKKEYELLKNELKNRIEDDIKNKINTMKILLKIRNGKLYVLDGYKRFEDFIFEFKIARTQAYKYIKIAKFLFEGKLKEVNIIENGIDKTLFNLNSIINLLLLGCDLSENTLQNKRNNISNLVGKNYMNDSNHKCLTKKESVGFKDSQKLDNNNNKTRSYYSRVSNFSNSHNKTHTSYKTINYKKAKAIRL